MLTPSLEQVKQLAKQYNTIPVFYDFSADNQTPINLYRAMSEGAKNAFIFESVNNGEQWGRYSFVGANPKQEIQMHSTTACILENNQKKTFMVEHNQFFIQKQIAVWHVNVIFRNIHQCFFQIPHGIISEIANQSACEIRCIRQNRSGILCHSFFQEQNGVFHHECFLLCNSESAHRWQLGCPVCSSSLESGRTGTEDSHL